VLSLCPSVSPSTFLPTDGWIFINLGMILMTIKMTSPLTFNVLSSLTLTYRWCERLTYERYDRHLMSPSIVSFCVLIDVRYAYEFF
jgi:hypothetical protein